MAEHEPTTVDAIAGDSTERGEPMPWEEVREVLADSQLYWLATAGPAGAPHVRPVLAVWNDGALYTTTSPQARKARNLERDGHCAVTVREEGYDLVLEGTATRVRDEPTLKAVQAAYDDKYGWPVTIEGDAFTAPYGAPTAGPPPYAPYAIVPETVFAFGTDDNRAPRSARFRF